MLAASLLKPNIIHSDENILAAMMRLKMPVWVTIKKDGIRGVKLENLYSRSLKLIPNVSIRSRAIRLSPGFDCELFNINLPYEQIESIVMSREHPDSDLIQFHVLDNFALGTYYTQRMQWLEGWNRETQFPDVKFEFPRRADEPEQLFDIFLDAEQSGAEGICFRIGCSPYKQGRSTLKEQYLVKLCRYHFSECKIVDFKEQMHNSSRSRTNAIGLTERSSFKHKQIGKDTLGTLIGVDLVTGKQVDIGTGFDDKLRKEIWTYKLKYLGKIVTYKFKGKAEKGVRSGVYQHFRKEGV